MSEIIPFWEFFLEASQHTGISPFLLAAIAWAESRFDANAISTKGAMGVMQISPVVWRGWGRGDVYNPKDNIACGAKYLRFLMALCDKWGKEEIKWSLACYVWGLGNVYRTKSWEEVPDGVKRYCERVEEKSKEFFVKHYIKELAQGVFYTNGRIKEV